MSSWNRVLRKCRGIYFVCLSVLFWGACSSQNEVAGGSDHPNQIVGKVRPHTGQTDSNLQYEVRLYQRSRSVSLARQVARIEDLPVLMDSLDCDSSGVFRFMDVNRGQYYVEAISSDSGGVVLSTQVVMALTSSDQGDPIELGYLALREPFSLDIPKDWLNEDGCDSIFFVVGTHYVSKEENGNCLIPFIASGEDYEIARIAQPSTILASFSAVSSAEQMSSSEEELRSSSLSSSLAVSSSSKESLSSAETLSSSSASQPSSSSEARSSSDVEKSSSSPESSSSQVVCGPSPVCPAGSALDVLSSMQGCVDSWRCAISDADYAQNYADSTLLELESNVVALTLKDGDTAHLTLNTVYEFQMTRNVSLGLSWVEKVIGEQSLIQYMWQGNLDSLASDSVLAEQKIRLKPIAPQFQELLWVYQSGDSLVAPLDTFRLWLDCPFK